MKPYYKADPWKVTEEGFNVAMNKASESIFSLGNGKMGTRANFEEAYTGRTLKGTYIGGIYYPDKTRVGWWKNGYPEYFAKVLNAPDFIGIDVKIESESLDLFTWRVSSFVRELDMKNGVLNRSFVATSATGNSVEVSTQRFLSMQQPDIAAIQYKIKALGKNVEVSLQPFLNGDVMNEDSNYNEQFWDIVDRASAETGTYLAAETKKLGFLVGMAMSSTALVGIANKPAMLTAYIKEGKQVGVRYSVLLLAGEEITLTKYVSVVTSLDSPKEKIRQTALKRVQEACSQGYLALLEEHKMWWHNKWETCSVEIEGDVEAQQGIHFNIFQLYQTYTGTDAKLNIGPKGFTGEKYGGSTYWDTEAYCLPFYMSTAGEEVALNLLRYRHKHLSKAIENAAKLGFNNGAALYPMVTMN
ncbi:MAG: glycoside hydrolase family 65 protein, partial [Bacteroidales bacterium]|nr:glycoside hydrolase family 65 protein [Bacteroidales bacterium]